MPVACAHVCLCMETMLSCMQALDVCYIEATKFIDQQAMRAIAALSPPSWTAAVIGSAAAIVAEAAKGSSAQQMLSQVTYTVSRMTCFLT